jgi:ribonuclease HI
VGGGGKASCFHRSSCEAPDFKALFEYVLHGFNKEQLALMAVISRRIWLRHNSWVFEGIFAHPDSVMKESISAQDDYRRCMKSGPTGADDRTIPCNRHSRWLPPPDQLIKVNWDASINEDQGWVGLGIVARDRNGFVLGAKSVTKELVAEPSIAEAIGALCAMHFCQEAGFFDVWFEGDAASMVKKINSSPPFLSKIGHFIESIHAELVNFRAAKFSFIPRECNEAAHNLAKEAKRNKIEQYWLEECPLSILNIVTREQLCP